MPDEDRKRALHWALVERVLSGPGRASARQRGQAYRNEGLPAPLDALVDKVATRPSEVTDADLAGAKALGIPEDHLFELVVCAAVGASSRQYEAGLAALAEATAGGRPDRAS